MGVPFHENGRRRTAAVKPSVVRNAGSAPTADLAESQGEGTQACPRQTTGGCGNRGVGRCDRGDPCGMACKATEREREPERLSAARIPSKGQRRLYWPGMNVPNSGS